MKYSYIVLLVAFLFSLPSFAGERWRETTENPDYLHRSIKKVTDVIVEDIFSPPVASRIYAYVSVAGYEASRPGSPKYATLAGQIPHLRPVPQPDGGKAYSYSIASVHAVLTVGKTLVFSDEKIESFRKQVLQELKVSGIPQEVYEISISYGQKVADHVMAWAAEDNYKQTRALDKHSYGDEAGTWQPTPPSYMKAVEPHWSKIRPFFISSADCQKSASTFLHANRVMFIQCPPGEIFFVANMTWPLMFILKGLQSQKLAIAFCSSVRFSPIS